MGSSGFTNPKELEIENEIEDVLKKFKLKRSTDFIFQGGAVQFTDASKVTSEVSKALKKYQ